MLPDAFITTEFSTKPAEIFPVSNWDHLLKLIGLIVVAEKQTRQKAIDVFLKAVEDLRAVIDPRTDLPRQKTRDWFLRNKQDLEATIDSRSYDQALYETLSPIKAMPHKADVISSMLRIAVSGECYSDLERDLINKTCLYWNGPETEFQGVITRGLTPNF